MTPISFAKESFNCYDPDLSLLVWLLLDKAGGQVDVHRPIGVIEANGQKKGSLGFRELLLPRVSDSQIDVGIRTGLVELDRLAEGRFGVGEFPFRGGGGSRLSENDRLRVEANATELPYEGEYCG